jgi:hypothetical protein
MGRFVLALAGIMLLILSAGLTRDQSPAISSSAGTPRAAAFQNNADAFRAELMVIERAATLPTPPRSPNEELLVPALLVYLALILVGSMGAVALARRRLHRES